MIRTTRLAAAFAFGVGFASAGVALAQSQTTSAAPPPITAQPAPSAESAPQWDPPGAIKLPHRDVDPPTYSVDPPPGGASGVYLPAAVLGYAKSAAGCVVVGCDDGPKAEGAPATSPSAPPPSQPSVNPGTADQH
jgi:hypothetical protein